MKSKKMNKYDYAAREDLELFGLYAIWDRAWEASTFDGDLQDTAKFMHKIFMKELKKRNLTKSKFLDTIRKVESEKGKYRC